MNLVYVAIGFACGVVATCGALLVLALMTPDKDD